MRTVLIAQDERHVYDELLLVAELAAKTYGSKRNAIRVLCEDSPRYRDFAAKIHHLMPLPDPPKRVAKDKPKAKRKR